MLERKPEVFGQMFSQTPAYGSSRLKASRAIVEGSSNGAGGPMALRATEEAEKPTSLSSMIKGRRAARESQGKRLPAQWAGRHTEGA